MMSQAMRKLAGNLNRTQTLCVFTNQIREKVGVMFGSPETQPGGRALKFYASQRLDIRRIETLKDGTGGGRQPGQVKVVKNKVAAPFKQAEFDIEFGKGISTSGCLLDYGIEHNIVTKSGSFFSYGDERLGQGRGNAKAFLDEHPEMAERDRGQGLRGAGHQPRSGEADRAAERQSERGRKTARQVSGRRWRRWKPLEAEQRGSTRPHARRRRRSPCAGAQRQRAPGARACPRLPLPRIARDRTVAEVHRQLAAPVAAAPRRSRRRSGRWASRATSTTLAMRACSPRTNGARAVGDRADPARAAPNGASTGSWSSRRWRPASTGSEISSSGARAAERRFPTPPRDRARARAGARRAVAQGLRERAGLGRASSRTQIARDGPPAARTTMLGSERTAPRAAKYQQIL